MFDLLLCLSHLPHFLYMFLNGLSCNILPGFRVLDSVAPSLGCKWRCNCWCYCCCLWFIPFVTETYCTNVDAIWFRLLELQNSVHCVQVLQPYLGIVSCFVVCRCPVICTIYVVWSLCWHSQLVVIWCRVCDFFKSSRFRSPVAGPKFSNVSGLVCWSCSTCGFVACFISFRACVVSVILDQLFLCVDVSNAIGDHLLVLRLTVELVVLVKCDHEWACCSFLFDLLRSIWFQDSVCLQLVWQSQNQKQHQ